MRKTHSDLTFAFTTLALILPCVASAVDFSVRPRIEGGLLSYDFEKEGGALTNPLPTTMLSAGNRAEGIFEVDDTIPFVSGGVTLFVDRFFVDISGLHGFDGEDEGSQRISETLVNIPFSAEDPFSRVTIFAAQDIEQEVDFDRDEYGISLGFQVTDNFVVFGGYKKTETDFDFDRRIRFIRNVTGFTSVGPIDIAQDVNQVDTTTIDIEQEGPFVGAGYAWNIDRGFFKGFITTNFALAFLDQDIDVEIKNAVLLGGTQTDNVTGAAQTIPSQQLPDASFPTLKGDTVGVTFGVGWRGFTNVEGLVYSVDVSGYDYSFDGDDELADSEESTLFFKVGAAYSF